MAVKKATKTTSRREVNRKNNRGVYVNGAAVKELQEIPARRQVPRQGQARRKTAEEPQRKEYSASQIKEEQRRIERNRAKAAGINRGFVLFLSIVCAALLVISIQYLQLKAQITTSQNQVSRLEAKLTDLKEENDAYYSQVTNNVDISAVKKIAIGRLGMRYPTEDQTETYQTARSSYVRQYQDVPD